MSITDIVWCVVLATLFGLWVARAVGRSGKGKTRMIALRGGTSISTGTAAAGQGCAFIVHSQHPGRDVCLPTAYEVQHYLIAQGINISDETYETLYAAQMSAYYQGVLNQEKPTLGDVDLPAFQQPSRSGRGVDLGKTQLINTSEIRDRPRLGPGENTLADGTIFDRNFTHDGQHVGPLHSRRDDDS